MKDDKNNQKAAFGAGCFWHVEEDFRQLKGVTNVTVGYMGGTKENPSYEDVCSNRTGHIETALVEYDPKKTQYEELLDKFFAIHNPTSMDRQGLDFGSQYRSAIFYYSDEQKKIAEKKISELNESGKFKKPVVTVLLSASELKFYKAEEYHQRYLEKHGLSSCNI